MFDAELGGEEKWKEHHSNEPELKCPGLYWWSAGVGLDIIR